jgi:hypothetical protein
MTEKQRTKKELTEKVIGNITTILCDQSRINNAQSEINREVITKVMDLVDRVRALEERLDLLLLENESMTKGDQ